MKKVENKMLDERAKALFGYDILLAANLAISACNYSSAVQTVLFNTFWLVGHANFFLKIALKTRVKRMLCLSTKLLYIFGVCTFDQDLENDPDR